MTAFEFSTAQRIKFGPGGARQLGGLTRAFGRRVALVTGGASLAASGRLAEIEAQFREVEIEWLHAPLAGGEPSVEAIDRLVEELKAFGAEAVVGVGGGSALDAAKAIAALLANGGHAIDYLEGVGNGATLAKPSLPCIAVPTTAGTGSEVTRNAVLRDEAKTFKKSMRSATMLPSLALVDPDLTRGCPPQVAAACGMDALTQLIEAYTSTRSNPFTDSFALQGIAYAAELPFLVADPEDDEARESMSLAALLGGICLANAGLGAVHGLASPLGALFQIPHGAACAALLPVVVRMNILRALEQNQPMPVLKYSTLFEILAGASNTDDDDAFEDEAGEAEAEETAGLEPTGGKIESIDWSEDSRASSGAEGEDEESLDADDDDQLDFEMAVDNALRLTRFLEDMIRSLPVPGLKQYGVRAADFERIIAGGRGASMQTNPVKLSDADLEQILEAAL